MGLIVVISVLLAVLVYIKYRPQCKEGKRYILDLVNMCNGTIFKNLFHKASIYVRPFCPSLKLSL